MSNFHTHLHSGRCYSSEECISFSQSPQTNFADVDKEMTYHLNVDHVQVSRLTQDEFDAFVTKYADRYKSVYFSRIQRLKTCPRFLSSEMWSICCSTTYGPPEIYGT